MADADTLAATEPGAANPRAAIVRFQKLKGRAAKGGHSYAGQRNHDLRLNNRPDYVDGARTHLNSHIIEPPPFEEWAEQVNERRCRAGQTRKTRMDANYAISGLLGFGLEAQEVIQTLTVTDQNRRFREAAEQMAAEMETDLIGLVVHRDESALHAHFMLAGYNEAGEPISGKMKNWRFRRAQDRASAVWSDLGIERGRSKRDRLAQGATPKDVTYRAVADYKRDTSWEALQAERRHEAVVAQLQAKEAELADAEARQEKARELAERAEARGKDVAETYRQRESNWAGKIERMKAELEALAAEQAEQERRIDELGEVDPGELEQARALNDDYASFIERMSDAAGAVVAGPDFTHGPVERVEAAVRADEAEIVEGTVTEEPARGDRPRRLYGVVLRHSQTTVMAPSWLEDRNTARQTAAALYRSARERFGDSLTASGLTTELADELARMVREDQERGLPVTVTVLDSVDQQALFPGYDEDDEPEPM